MNQYLAATAKLTVLSATLLAAGCGGGGGGSTLAPAGVPDVAAPAPAPVAQRNVSGVAAKGTIKKARVQVFALDAAGTKGTTALASTVTGDDGSYAFKVATTALSFVIEIDAATGATMADEATGQDVEFPADLKLRTVVKLAEANDSAVVSHVSPWTEMAVKAAEATTGGLNAANIAQAKSGVAAVLGFDAEKVKPVNANLAAAAAGSMDERVQSLTLAAISKLAQDSKLGCVQTSASARIGCVVNLVAKSASISGDKLVLSENVRSELRTALTAVVALPAINQTGLTSVSGLPAFGAASVPTPPAPSTGVAAAKKLFASLRTNVQAWTDSTSTSGALTVQYDAVQADFNKAAAAPADGDLLTWVQMSSEALDYFARYKAGSIGANSQFYTFASGASATCGVYSDAAATVKATSAANALNVACAAQRTGAFVSSTSTTQTNVALGSEIVLTPVSGAAGSFTYAARATRGTVVFNRTNFSNTYSAKTTVGSYGAGERATGTVTYSAPGNQIASVTIKGMMPARMTNDGIALTDYEMWNFTMVRSALDGGVYTYALSGDLASWLGGATVGKVTMNTGSFARLAEDKNDSVRNFLKEVSLSVVAEAGRSKIAGLIHLENYTADKNGYNLTPAKTTYTGTVSNNGVQFFSGMLSLELGNYQLFNGDLAVSATNFAKLTTAVSGTFTIAARPPLLLSATSIETSPTAGTETAQYNDGTNVINASRVRNGTAAATINLASTDGVTVALTGADTADVMKDGAKVAVINVKTSIINYVDGSFESLK